MVIFFVCLFWSSRRLKVLSLLYNTRLDSQNRRSNSAKQKINVLFLSSLIHRDQATIGCDVRGQKCHSNRAKKKHKAVISDETKIELFVNNVQS